MSMTLGFDAFGHFARLLGDAGARDVLVAFAKHAPDQRAIRAGKYAEPYDVLEATAAGELGAPADLAAIQAAISKAGFASWANDDAPEMLTRVILPGGEWDVDALRDEDAIQKLCDADPYIEDFLGADQARGYVDGKASKLLATATTHRLITVFR